MNSFQQAELQFLKDKADFYRRANQIFFKLFNEAVKMRESGYYFPDNEIDTLQINAEYYFTRSLLFSQEWEDKTRLYEGQEVEAGG